jgi:hypothetical protein
MNDVGIVMMGYIRIGRLCAFHIELSRRLSALPLWAQQDMAGEQVFDLPFCRIIFTPRARLLNAEATADFEHDPAYSPFSAPVAGTPKH